MPILETSNIIYKETRIEELRSLSRIFDNYSDSILNIRIGGTDFSKYFGLRRNYNNTIYDLCVVRDCISDIINFFLREDKDYVVSAPVWEYFSSNNFDICQYSKGLIKELIMDKANGLIGKTIIHPSQANIVNALFTVEYEEYIDALSILSSDANHLGVIKSDFSNKMNEIKPHFNWASKIIKRANVYGVFNHGFDYTSII
jgi:citrate lyase beta subunit